MHAYLIEGACGKIVCHLFVEGKKMKKNASLLFFTMISFLLLLRHMGVSMKIF